MTIKKTKPMSCGIVVKCADRVLLCRATKFLDNEGREVWGLPKGMRDEGETPVQAAIRETYEETGLKFDHLDLQFLAHYTTKKKDYRFYIVEVPSVSIPFLKCITMVDEEERNYPEVDKYVMATREDFDNLVFNSQCKLVQNEFTSKLMFDDEVQE